MNKTEYLLVCLSEECAEVIKAVSKALRFGLKDGYPKGDTTNLQDIARELSHIDNIKLMLNLRGVCFKELPLSEILKKKTQVEKYMNYAQSKGTLTTPKRS